MAVRFIASMSCRKLSACGLVPRSTVMVRSAGVVLIVGRSAVKAASVVAAFRRESSSPHSACTWLPIAAAIGSADVVGVVLVGATGQYEAGRAAPR